MSSWINLSVFMEILHYESLIIATIISEKTEQHY